MKTFLQNFYFNIVHIQKKPGNQDSSAHTSYSLCIPVPCLHLEDANYFKFHFIYRYQKFSSLSLQENRLQLLY